jgi:RecA-family ATPase
MSTEQSIKPCKPSGKPVEQQTITSSDANTPAFPTGMGQRDTNIKTGQPYDVVTARHIMKMVKDPPSVPKENGQWFIPSTYAAHDARTHATQQENGIFRWLTLDVDDNNLNLHEISDALHKVVRDVHWLIYSSRGATEQNKKWRALIPIRNELEGIDFAETQTAFFDLLKEASGGTLIPDGSLSKTGQLVYLPNRGDFYECEIRKGNAKLDLSAEHPIISTRDAMRAKNAAIKAKVKDERNKRNARRRLNEQNDDVSPVEYFNDKHSISGLLARYNYQQQGSSNHWRSPLQTGKTYATQDYGDYWVSLSGSDACAEIGKETETGRFGDAFDLYRYFEHENSFTAAVRSYANEAGLNHPRETQPNDDFNEFDEVETTMQTQDGLAKQQATIKFNSFLEGIFAASELEGHIVRPRSWHVQDLIPCNTVTLFSGDGGTGKSLLALQLAVSTASARPWLRMAVKEGSALYLSAEDDRDELARRIKDIQQAEGVPFSDISKLKCRSLAGEDALLATLQKDGALQPTHLLKAIEHLLERDKPDLVVLDTLADYFPGNENDRSQARQFIGMLRGLAIRHNCTVFLLAHPSLTGINSGTGTSGSTGWNNSVRSRLYLSRVKQDGYEANPNARVLQTMKSNYASIGGEIALTWQDGVFVAGAPISGLDRMAVSAKAERLFLTFLRQSEEQGRRLSYAGGQTYAPRVFEAHPDAEGVTKRAFKQAMENLLHSGKIKIGEDGPPSKRRKFLMVA